MRRVVLLDATPLSLLSNPKPEGQAHICQQWLANVQMRGMGVYVPEITDYEVRRELLRADKQRSIARLDQLAVDLGYIALTTEMLHIAAQLWAEMRRRGKPTADAAALDGDVILAAQAIEVINRGYTVVVAMSNVRHLSEMVPAQEWWLVG